MGSEIDQLYKIYHVLGTPDVTASPIGANDSRLLDRVGYEVVSVHMEGVRLCSMYLLILFYQVLVPPHLSVISVFILGSTYEAF